MLVTVLKMRGQIVEQDIRPPLAHAVTIPLAIDGRHPHEDGYVIYVGIGAYAEPGRDAEKTLKKVAAAISDHLKNLPPITD
jgi:hypothetical protein